MVEGNSSKFLAHKRPEEKQRQTPGGGQQIPLFGRSVYIEDDFYKRADVLRAQLEEQVSKFTEANAGLTPFGFAFVENRYQFLTASAERIFTPDLLEDFIDRIRTWAEKQVEASHVSTPHTRVYIDGCSRTLLRDEVGAPWHYLLSMSCRGASQKTGQVKILTNSVTSRHSQEVDVNKVISLNLDFNQLLVHKTEQAYSIVTKKAPMNPLSGLVFLDGYLW